MELALFEVQSKREALPWDWARAIGVALAFPRAESGCCLGPTPVKSVPIVGLSTLLAEPANIGVGAHVVGVLKARGPAG